MSFTSDAGSETINYYSSVPSYHQSPSPSYHHNYYQQHASDSTSTPINYFAYQPSYNNYSVPYQWNSAPMWSSYQPPTNLNGSYVHDSGYSSSSSSLVTDETSLESKKRTIDTVENENQDSETTDKGKKKPRIFKVVSGSKSIDEDTVCMICGVDCQSMSKCLMHVHRVHNNRDPTECPICFKKFGSQANTMTHLKAHTQEKNYKCQRCNLAFCDSSTLKKHMRVHTGEKPFKCEICSRKFSQSGNMKRHLATHSKPKLEQNESNVSTSSELPNAVNNDASLQYRFLTSSQANQSAHFNFYNYYINN